MYGSPGRLGLRSLPVSAAGWEVGIRPGRVALPAIAAPVSGCGLSTGGIVCLPVCASAHNPAVVLQILLGANTIDSKKELANIMTAL